MKILHVLFFGLIFSSGFSCTEKKADAAELPNVHLIFPSLEVLTSSSYPDSELVILKNVQLTEEEINQSVESFLGGHWFKLNRNHVKEALDDFRNEDCEEITIRKKDSMIGFDEGFKMITTTVEKSTEDIEKSLFRDYRGLRYYTSKQFPSVYISLHVIFEEKEGEDKPTLIRLRRANKLQGIQ